MQELPCGAAGNRAAGTELSSAAPGTRPRHATAGAIHAATGSWDIEESIQVTLGWQAAAGPIRSWAIAGDVSSVANVAGPNAARIRPADISGIRSTDVADIRPRSTTSAGRRKFAKRLPPAARHFEAARVRRPRHRGRVSTEVPATAVACAATTSADSAAATAAAEVRTTTTASAPTSAAAKPATTTPAAGQEVIRHQGTHREQNDCNQKRAFHVSTS
jgi:hypothetical protein